MIDQTTRVERRLTWAEETMRTINKLTPDIRGKSFDPDWFLLRQRLEQFEADAQAALVAYQKVKALPEKWEATPNIFDDYFSSDLRAALRGEER